MTAAMQYAETHALMKEDDYGYNGWEDDCASNATKGKVNVTAIHAVTPNNSTQLLAAIAQGPVSVAIDADCDAFQYYQDGVFDGFGCGTDLDHGVTITGYDIDMGYYEVKNSWGDWGDGGYIQIAITEGEGTCGIQKEPVWPETN